MIDRKHAETVAAIIRLRPGASFAVKGDTIEWLDDEQTEPTADEIDADLKAHKYVAERVAAYPSIGDQLDLIYHDVDEWRNVITAIKNQHPKPTA